eukprot:SM000077S21602  [mRNA]  locus=s77:450566:456127:- [translate_table: standard]
MRQLGNMCQCELGYWRPGSATRRQVDMGRQVEIPLQLAAAAEDGAAYACYREAAWDEAVTTPLAPVRLGAAAAGHRPVVQVRQVEELVDRAWQQLPLVAQELQCVRRRLCSCAENRWWITAGVALVEFFGGIATGLAAVLANGVRVRRYVYVDPDPVAQAAAAHHIRRLMDQEEPVATRGPAAGGRGGARVATTAGGRGSREREAVW